ncbi:MAG: copper chaperone PCu(A)C [Xanthobacteraceae bacterium]|uniref:copper chaperone PCu(A)C n=1 Tax=Pseudolabrys sp. TaxID=1960880 RepID=UPI003D09C8F2
MNRFVLAAIAAIVFVVPASAHDYTLGALKIGHPWARATPKGATVGGGYLTITNTGKEADRLVGGSTDVAGKVEFHEMSMEGGVMKMRPLANGLTIKPGETVALKPGGYHVMFMGLKKPLVEGQSFKGTLVFEKAGKIEVDFKIDKIAAQSSGAMDHKMDHGGMGNMKH